MRVFKKYFLYIFALVFVLSGSNQLFAQTTKTLEFDNLRAKMSYIIDKNSEEYKINKQKLDKIIVQQKIPYTQQARFNDAVRLIQEQKYNAAIFELNNLIEEKYNLSKSYELLGDICYNSKRPVKKTVQYYKNALKHDSTNVSVMLKLSKLYLSQNKNILGMEYVSMLVDNTDDYQILSDIENTILNTATPMNKYEINNFYETLGNVQLKLGKRKDSYNNFIKALRANPNDIFLKYYLVQLLYEDNCMQDVVKLVDIILFQNKNDIQLRITKAKALGIMGDTTSAYNEYVEILKQNPNSAQAKYAIFKLFEDKITLEDILSRINFSKYAYVVKKEDCFEFAKLLKSFDDINGAKKYVNLGRQIQEDELRRIEQEREQERLRQQEILLEKQRKEQEKQRLRELEIQKQKEAELKKQRELQLQQERIRKQKELQEAKIKAQKEEQQRKAQLEAERKQKLKEEAQKQAELRAEQEIKRQEELKKQAELKAQQEKQKQEKLAQEKAELAKKQAEFQRQKAQQQKLQAQKQAELRAQQEKQKQEKLAQEKEKQQQILAEQEKKKAELKAQEDKIKKEQEQKEYEQRKISQELNAFKTKNPKKYDEYNKTLNSYLKIEPKDAKTYLAIANTYKLLEAPTASLGYYKEAIKLSPTDSDLYYSMALSYMELDSFETAYINLEKALKLDSNNTKVKNLLPFVQQKLVTRYINSAYSDFEAKKYFEASLTLDEGIKKFPKAAQLYYYRALAYDAMKRNAAAIIDLQQAVNLDSSLYMAFYQLGKSYEKIKDERNALVAYERFLSIEPDEKELINEVQKKVLALSKKYY